MKPFVLGLALCGLLALARADSIRLERTIPLPDVTGRIDHFVADSSEERLFVAALGNNTVEVVDLKQGRVVHSIAGLSEPQGIVFLPELNRLYVANGGDGVLRIYDGTSYAPISSVELGDEADNVRYDASAKAVLVGYGSGGLAFVDAVSGNKTADVPLEGHPESFQLEKSGSRIFINVPGAHQIAVVDRHSMKVISTWGTGSARSNFPMTLDEAHHRLFVGCRSPASLLVLDTESGAVVAKLDLDGDCDDLFFSAALGQIFASCGKGYFDIFAQADADHYALKERAATIAGARTCSFDGHHLFLAVPRRGDQPAAIRCYIQNP